MPEQHIQYPPLTPDLEKGLNWRALKYFGAGAIMASVTIGSGETFFASTGGATFSYVILWCFVGGALMKGVQVYTAARYLTLTGSHPMTHWAHLPGPRGWVPWVMTILCLICFPFWQAGLPMFLGKTLNIWFLGDDEIRTKLGKPLISSETYLLYARYWSMLFIFLAVGLSMVQQYKWLEKAQTAIVGLLLFCVLVACFAARPDWWAALKGMLIPSVPEYAEWVKEKYPKVAAKPPIAELIVFLGAIGGGTYDYIGYIGFMREKGWGAMGLGDKYRVDTEAPRGVLPIDASESNVKRGLRWLVPAKIDTGVATLSVVIFTIGFVVLGASILYPAHQIPNNDDGVMKYQAQFLTSLHPSLEIIYQVGIFFAFWGTIYGAYEVYVRTAYECMAPIIPRVRRMPLDKFRTYLLLYCGLGAVILIWLTDNPQDTVAPAAIIGGVFACGLWCFLMLWTDRRFLPVPLRMKPLLWGLTFIAGTVMTSAGAWAIWTKLLVPMAQWFGK